MKLLAIVGISGSGKTTVAEVIIHGLRRKGFSIASTWQHWSGSCSGKPLLSAADAAPRRNGGHNSTKP